MTAILSAERFEAAELAGIADGDYPGVWGGYEAKALINGRKYRFRTKDGIRTPKAACVIQIRAGVGTVEAIDGGEIPKEWR